MFQGHFLHHQLDGLDDKILVVDVYDPYNLENLEFARHLDVEPSAERERPRPGVAERPDAPWGLLPLRQ